VHRWENVVRLDNRDHRVNRDRLEVLELLDRRVRLVNRVLMDQVDQQVSRETQASLDRRAVLVSRDNKVLPERLDTPGQLVSQDLLVLLEALDSPDSLVKLGHRVQSDHKDLAVCRVPMEQPDSLGQLVPRDPVETVVQLANVALSVLMDFLELPASPATPASRVLRVLLVPSVLLARSAHQDQ
jgi:hypothetical protein